MFTWLILVSFQVRYAEEMGSSHRDGSLLLSYIGIGSGVGKIIFGKASDRTFINTLRLYNFCMVLSGISSLLAIFAAGYQMLVLYVVVLGLLDGCIIGLMSIVTFECTDRDKMSEAWGGVLMIQSFSMLLGAPAAGENNYFCLQFRRLLSVLFFSILVSTWFIINSLLFSILVNCYFVRCPLM